MRRIKPYKGAGIALFHNDGDGYMIFLGQRSTNQDYGKWSIPGGGFDVKKDTSFKDCAEREFEEETGLPVPSDHVDIGVKKTHIPFFHWKTYLYIVNDDLENNRPQEFFCFRWVRFDELRNYPLCWGVKAEVRKFKRLVNRAARQSLRRP